MTRPRFTDAEVRASARVDMFMGRRAQAIIDEHGPYTEASATLMLVLTDDDLEAIRRTREDARMAVLQERLGSQAALAERLRAVMDDETAKALREATYMDAAEFAVLRSAWRKDCEYLAAAFWEGMFSDE